jgi:hypothetical protein
MLKMAIKSNACVVMAKLIDVNPLMRIWCILSTSILLAYSFLEYFKLVKTSLVAWKMNNILVPWHFANLSYIID